LWLPFKIQKTTPTVSLPVITIAVVTADYENQVSIIESRIAIENKHLEDLNKETTLEIEKITEEREIINIKAELLNEELGRAKEEIEKLKVNQDLQDRVKQWESEKAQYINDNIWDQRLQYKRNSKKAWGALCMILISAVIIPFLFKIDLRFLKKPIWGSIIILILYLIVALILFWRLFLADKEVVKNGCDWILSLGIEKKKIKIIGQIQDWFF
jgi:hypothetical protein